MNQIKEKEIIERFTENLNQKEKINELAVIGREEEIKQLIYILSRLIKNNPLLIGHPGVGKTAIVEGLVQRIKQGRVPLYLQNKTVYQLKIGALMAGTMFQGELEKRLETIIKFMAQPENNAILFIDEIHLIVGAGRVQGALDMANLLKPVLARGEIQCIGATTQEEYRQYIEKDGALVRRFSNVVVGEPTEAESINILRGIKNYLEVYYELKISDKSLIAAVKLSQRYLTDTYLPDKAIDLLDETCGRIRSEMWYEPEIITETRKTLQELKMREAILSQEKNQDTELLLLKQKIFEQENELKRLVEQDRKESRAIEELNNCKKEIIQYEKELTDYQEKKMDFNKVAEIKNYVLPRLKKELAEREREISQNELRKCSVEEEYIADTIAKKHGLPVRKILLNEQQKLFLMSTILQQKVKGQSWALRVVSDAIFRARAGIQDPNRPLASFLFVGPTGVGKTEVALTIAEQLFDQKKNLIRLDMSEYTEPHSVSKLVGSPPGYIGFEDKPQLEVIREKMYSVVLFDEIEKCHPEVINLLLQILDNGFLTLANGREVNFRNTIIILTTNLGSELYFEGRERSELEKELDLELKSHFRPEFLNRLDEMVFFNSLSEEVIREIIIKELKLFSERVSREKMIKLDYHNEKLVKKILQENRTYFPEYGARPIKHYIEKQIGTLVARGIVAQFLRPGGNYQLDVEKETEEIKINTLSLLEAKRKEKSIE